MAPFAAMCRPSLDLLCLSPPCSLIRPSPLWISMDAADRSSGIPTAKTVTVSYSEIKARDLSMEIEQGFGAHGLGIITMSDVPGVPLLRQNLIHLASGVAVPPDDVKRDLEDPESSHGKENLESGKVDFFKGSFYDNPISDSPKTALAAIYRYASYCRPNKWPATSLPELEAGSDGWRRKIGATLFDLGLNTISQLSQQISQLLRIGPLPADSA